MQACCGELSREFAIIENVFIVTLAGFSLGAVVMAAGTRDVPAHVARARWYKLAVFFVIVQVVLVSAALGRPWVVALLSLVLLAGTAELVQAWQRIGSPRPAAVWPLYFAVAAAALWNATRLTPEAFAFLFLAAAAGDGFAEVVGQWLGRRKLAPRVSPAKTIEGFLGGLCAAGSVAAFASALVGLSPAHAALIGLMTCVAGLVGDLAASWVKRRAASRTIPARYPGREAFWIDSTACSARSPSWAGASSAGRRHAIGMGAIGSMLCAAFIATCFSRLFFFWIAGRNLGKGSSTPRNDAMPDYAVRRAPGASMAARVKRVSLALLLTGSVALLADCDARNPQGAGPSKPSDSAASDATVAPNRKIAELPLGDPQDFEDARRGLIGGDGEVTITAADGRVIWRTADYAFVGGEAPPTVNPSLWRQAQLNGVHGLFEVAPGIHQVRGYDLSNLTLIDGATGWIVVDTLTSRETAAAAMALARRHLGDKPVVAVIFTHNHIDHFAGIDAVLPADAAARAAVRVIAPRGFLEEATSENVLAGTAMSRRATYMYGMPLGRDARGHVDTGLGKQPARGTVGIVVPTDLIDHTPQELTVDGVRFVFQYVPDSEAPAELAFYLPDKRAYCGAEIATHTLHNVYTLRGAKVRDALRWSDYLDEALHRFGDAEVLFASHHWPVWGDARVRALLAPSATRTVICTTRRCGSPTRAPRRERSPRRSSCRARCAPRSRIAATTARSGTTPKRSTNGTSAGTTATRPISIPCRRPRRVRATSRPWEGRRRCSRRRMPLPTRATTAGRRRCWIIWCSQSHTTRRRARYSRQVYDQLGYQAESGPWRDEYLTAALELRRGVQSEPLDLASTADLLRHLPPDLFLRSLATRLNGPRAEGKRTS